MAYFGQLPFCYADQIKGGPIVVNGDVLEYSTDQQEVSAQGNVSVTYKGATLTCDKLTVNTQTKDASAEGNVKLVDSEHGVIMGPEMSYNFETKKGVIIDAEFRANPYFGKADKLEKVSDKEFVAYKGYASTCDYDHPHYRMQAGRVNMFPGDKVQIRDTRVYIGDIPILYLPYYNHSLKDPMMHVRFSPGTRKEWGGYVLSAWRYNLTENLTGRVYLDYRQKLGFAEGFGANYNTKYFGKGDFKFYFSEERPEDRSLGEPKQFNRYLARLRHKWDIDKNTYFISEYYKIYDEKRKYAPTSDGFLKEYFYREFEKETQPVSYALMQHYFSSAALSLLFQKRTNAWFDYVEKKPEARFSMPAYRLGQLPVYFSNESTFANFNQKSTGVGDDINVFRLDTNNKISIPSKLSFINVTPFVGERGTYYDTGADNSSSLMRGIFYTGVEVSTKFFRVLNVKSNFLGLDVDGLRHVITPAIRYQYDHNPTVSRTLIKQIDDIDRLAASNAAYIELSNKLQTKRNGATVDLLDFLVTTDYAFNSMDTVNNIKRTDEFSDILLKLKVLPFAWLRVDFDATYKRTGLKSDPGYGHFSDISYDFNFTWDKGRTLGIGQRYEKAGSNEIIAQLNWRINPKWAFKVYERLNTTNSADLQRGLLEQEYTISRDLHCWLMDMSYNISKENGHTVWVVFRLKAFPETEFDFDQTYHKPKAGSD